MARPTWAVIAGGGTAGHVAPALAVAEALVDRGHDRSTIRFVGARRGMEAEMVPAAGFDVLLLPGRGLPRRVSVQNALSALALAVAVVLALVSFVRRRPAVVVSVGGYASVAAALAAVVLRIPLVVHEQNAVPGAVNRVVGRWARACAVSFAGTALPRTVVTGNPVRPQILGATRTAEGRAEARRALGVPDARFLLASTGGSLGSRRINDAVVALADRWRDREDVAIYQVAGRRDHDNVAASLDTRPAGALWHRLVAYEHRMELVYAAADVVVARSGGNTVAELAVAGVPAVLVPLPIATEDHQSANAQAVVAAGGAVLVPDAELDGDRLERELAPLVSDPARRAALSAAMASRAVRDASERIAALAEEHARG